MLLIHIMKSFINYLFIFGFIAVTVVSCVKKTTYPKAPQIEYKDFFPFTGDSGEIQIKFTDGDGNIGVGQDDTTNSLYVTYYYKDTLTNQYVGYYSQNINDTLKTGYVVRAPADSYKGKPISGEVSVKLQAYRHSKKIKNVKYVIYLYDSEGNKSNVLTTPEISVP